MWGDKGGENGKLSTRCTFASVIVQTTSNCEVGSSGADAECEPPLVLHVIYIIVCALDDP